MKSFQNYFTVLYCTRNHVWNWYNIISTAETISKLFQRH